MKAKKEGMKKGGVFVVLPVLLLFFVAMATAPVASAGWDYCRQITIDHNKVSGTLTDFPVLINLSYDWLKDSGHGGKVKQSDGGDIVFTNEANTTKLDHEIEEYDGTTGKLIAWVKIPSLSASSPNTTIWMYYGNSDCANQWNPTGVWDDNYKMVQHLNETSGTQYDSTQYNNEGTPYGNMNKDVTGKIDGADYFDGLDDYVEVPDDDSLDFGTGDFSVSAWVQTTSATGGDKAYGGVVDKESSTPVGWIFSIGDTANKGKVRFYIWKTDYQVNLISIGTVDDGNWHHIVILRDGTRQSIYIDGSLDNTGTGTIRDVTNMQSLKIGKRRTGQNFYFKGTIDEVRVSNTVRSGDWINTSHNNQRYPDKDVYPTNGFYTVDMDEQGPCYPVPELSTLVLLSIGLLALTGYVVLRKRR